MACSIHISRFTAIMVVFAFASLCYVSVNCAGNNLPANFVFGDSLVDAGNNDYFVSLSKADYAPNGIDFPNQVPTGRYTNGLTIVDIVGQKVGLADLTPPYLAPNTTGSVVLKGVNYASGGSGILNETGAIVCKPELYQTDEPGSAAVKIWHLAATGLSDRNETGGRIHLDAQIDNFANTRQDIISSIGTKKGMNLIRKGLFSVTTGSNDFITNYLISFILASERTAMSPDAFIEELISKYRLQLMRLYSLGARKIITVNVGPIGCIPYLRDTQNVGGKGCADFPNQLAQGFNARLKDIVAELSTNLKGSLFVYANVYRIVADIIDNYKRYGFEVPDSACCFLIGQHGGIVPCGPSPSKVCPGRSKYVFWDAYHPSDASNVIIAKRLLDGDLNDISPMNIRQLLQA